MRRIFPCSYSISPNGIYNRFRVPTDKHISILHNTLPLDNRDWIYEYRDTTVNEQ